MTDGPPKRSITIAGHRTSLSLEPEFWDAIKSLAKAQNLSTAQLITKIDQSRSDRNLSSACRVYVLQAVQNGKPHTNAAEPD
ncbi:hypothetical protein MNBD_ALPHA08-1053 [hydrothermal vent metagenome]|uniref:Ribbon-helix-helix domain-containing protein n=1 Tax=hydrothermal vent metagenome TaxID=652676 RepID=A0A3B0RPR2_9ZZZZ